MVVLGVLEFSVGFPEPSGFSYKERNKNWQSWENTRKPRTKLGKPKRNSGNPGSYFLLIIFLFKECREWGADTDAVSLTTAEAGYSPSDKPEDGECGDGRRAPAQAQGSS